MTTRSLDGHLGTQVELDLCAACQVIWFDRLESLRLAPGATLSLFKTIGEGKQTAPPRLADPLKCPRCGIRLLATHDRQRNTPFQYRRCPREHGRLITFFDFLREKDFVRPLSAAQLAELRTNVKTVNCSNCGAPIDLVHTSECAHCGTPVSMLDVKQIEAAVAALKQADEEARTIDPTWPARIEFERHQVNALFDALRAESGGGAPSGVVEMGLRLFTKWFP